jgi:hypothetical protein
LHCRHVIGRPRKQSRGIATCRISGRFSVGIAPAGGCDDFERDVWIFSAEQFVSGGRTQA